METKINKLKKRILEVAYRDEMGHIPSALSILDIVWFLHDEVMDKKDQFILSKGHGVMALYAVLEEKGLIQWNSRLMGHPKRGGAILASTGSLGHGLPIAVGLAFAKKLRKESGKVYCLVGDGECNEGTIWESIALAVHRKLDNLVVIVDQNHSSDRALDNQELEKKFGAFGCLTSNIDGHNEDMITSITACTGSGKPFVVVADTIKGNGIPFMKNNPEWHNKKIDKETYEKSICYLN